jgi:hypothetical protein
VLKNLYKTPRPLIFNWFFGTFHDNLYKSMLSSIDLFLAAGQAQKKYLERHGVPPERIALVGMSRYDHLYTFKKEFNKSHSLSFLNIPDDFSYYILFDPNATLRGYLSAQEQLSVTKTLLEFAGQHPEVALLVKPHPSQRSGTQEGLIDSFSLPNVFLIEKKMLRYYALNAADLLIVDDRPGCHASFKGGAISGAGWRRTLQDPRRGGGEYQQPGSPEGDLNHVG